MDEKVVEAILIQLAQISAEQKTILETVSKITADFQEFAERFDEVVTQLEDERRLDLLGDYN